MEWKVYKFMGTGFSKGNMARFLMKYESNRVLFITIIISFFCGCAIANESENNIEKNAVAFAKSALGFWKSKDWGGMYSCLSSKDKESNSLEVFSEKRQMLSESRTLEGYEINSVTKMDDDSVALSISLMLKENYNARYEFDGEDKIVKFETTWTIVHEGDKLYLTFLR